MVRFMNRGAIRGPVLRRAGSGYMFVAHRMCELLGGHTLYVPHGMWSKALIAGPLP